MKLITTVSHDIKFTVEYFEPTEGGMDNDTYGKPVDAVAAAIRLLELAKEAHPNYEWVIVGHVTTQTSGKEIA